MNRLRQGDCWRTTNLEIFPEEATPLEGVSGLSLDIVITLDRCAPRKTLLPSAAPEANTNDAKGHILTTLPVCRCVGMGEEHVLQRSGQGICAGCFERVGGCVVHCRGSASAAGLLLRSWNAGGEGSAAILVDWENCKLEAIFEGGGGRDLAAATDLDSDTDGQRRVGGPIELLPGEPVTVCHPLSVSGLRDELLTSHPVRLHFVTLSTGPSWLPVHDTGVCTAALAMNLRQNITVQALLNMTWGWRKRACCEQCNAEHVCVSWWRRCECWWTTAAWRCT